MKEKKEKSIIRLSQSCVHSKIIARKKERQAGWCLRSEGPSFSSRSRGALESEESMRAVPPIGNKFSGCKGTIEKREGRRKKIRRIVKVGRSFFQDCSRR